MVDVHPLDARFVEEASSQTPTHGEKMSAVRETVQIGGIFLSTFHREDAEQTRNGGGWSQMVISLGPASDCTRGSKAMTKDFP